MEATRKYYSILAINQKSTEKCYGKIRCAETFVTSRNELQRRKALIFRIISIRCKPTIH